MSPVSLPTKNTSAMASSQSSYLVANNTVTNTATTLPLNAPVNKDTKQDNSTTIERCKTEVTKKTTSIAKSDHHNKQQKSSHSNPNKRHIKSCNGRDNLSSDKELVRSNAIATDYDSSSSNKSKASGDTNVNANVKNECDQLVVIKSEDAVGNMNNTAALVEEIENENQNDLNENNILSKHCPVLLNSINPHIICNLCFGYLIDATTIVECLHSFCHSCLIKHLRSEQYCPCCEMMINTAKPNIKPDTTLQAIVYKLVPGLYERELMRKRAFYKDRPEEAAQATPEQRGEDTEHLIFSPSDYISLSLEYADIHEHIGSNNDYSELLKPRYLQCPSMYTVAHLKKFVHGKFDIDVNRFNIDIMYKVKTIVLLDHYTLMDVAYIYTWKRDAPMRFYFRVKESLRPIIKEKKIAAPIAKKEVIVESHEPAACFDAMTVIHEPTPSINSSEILPVTEIKVEDDPETNATIPTVQETRRFEIVPNVHLSSPNSSFNEDETNTDRLKITLVSKNSKETSYTAESKSSAQIKPNKERKDCAIPNGKDERKVENIKLKIDLSKQNSVTIINMSDPQRKEVTKSVKPEKEWKVKNKKDKESSPKSSSSDRRSKNLSPLTVPPITIKAERISPLSKMSPKSQSSTNSRVSSKISSPKTSEDEEEKSKFLKSFALTPINAIKVETPKKNISPVLTSLPVFTKPFYTTKELVKTPTNVILKTAGPSKRKSKEPVKAITKKPKMSPPLPAHDFKIKLPPNPINPPISTKTAPTNDKPLMPPPGPMPIMRPPCGPPKKVQRPNSKFASPGSLTPHPSFGGIPLAPPGNRTPIAKRYQPILPKAARPNPFANIPSDVNKLLKDAGTEIKSIASDTNISKVYGPKAQNKLMGPPPSPNQNNLVTSHAATNRVNSTSNANNRVNQSPSSNKSGNSAKLSNSNNFLNLALFNSSKSKGNEVPPGCRTPMYTPSSPIYSPSSPQYVPNYNIPTMPTYKYTPKPTNTKNSYLQNVLGSNSQLSSLFPAPPTKKDTSSSICSNTPTTKSESRKHVYPFTRSPSPIEDPPEKQLKVKSLLNSCNINIPSSLSITITREDSESQSNNASYPKHKSPVNNYIEILKLPDQSADYFETTKRLSPPAQKHTSSTMLPTNKKDNLDMKTTSSQSLGMPPAQHINHKHPNTTTGNAISKPNVSIHSVPKSTTPSTNGTTTLTDSNQQLISSYQKQLQTLPTPKAHNQKQHPPNTPLDKKTPSPEKRSADQLAAVPSGDNKSPKSPNTSTDPAAVQAGKKFRHILPRQNQTQAPEVIPPKVTSASIIGTYSSPSGVAVKIHANKKVLPTKKSPNSQQLPKPQASGCVLTPQRSPNQTSKIASSLKSPPTSSSSSNVTKSTKTVMPPQQPTVPVLAANSVNNLVAHHPLATMPPTSHLPHPMHALAGLPNMPPHLGSGAAATNAASQAEISKFLKENFLRAQVQAAAANQSNMFYSYANAAAQMGQYSPSMYNYQQAYIMEQLSRMQRVGNDAFTEYMQKLKNGIDNKTPTTTEANNSTESAKTALTLSSPKTATTTPPPSASLPNNSSTKCNPTSKAK